MTKRLSRDAKAWRKIAREFEKYANGAKQNDITQEGLCCAADQFEIEEFGRYYEGWPYNDNMYGPTYEEEPRAWWWPLSRKGAEQRAIFAWLMSEVS